MAACLVVCLWGTAALGQETCVETGMDNPPSWVRTLAADGKRFRYYIGQQSGSSFQTAFEGALGQVTP